MGDEINLMNESDDISLLSAEYTLDKNFKVYANAAYLTYNFSFVDVSQKKNIDRANEFNEGTIKEGNDYARQICGICDGGGTCTPSTVSTNLGNIQIEKLVMVNGDYSYFSCLYIISDVVLTNKYFNIRFIVNGSIKGTVKAKLVAGAYKKNRYYFSDEDKNYYHHDTHTGAEDSLFNNILRNSSVVNKTVNAYIWFTNS